MVIHSDANMSAWRAVILREGPSTLLCERSFYGFEQPFLLHRFWGEVAGFSPIGAYLVALRVSRSGDGDGNRQPGFWLSFSRLERFVRLQVPDMSVERSAATRRAPTCTAPVRGRPRARRCPRASEKRLRRPLPGRALRSPWGRARSRR